MVYAAVKARVGRDRADLGIARLDLAGAALSGGWSNVRPLAPVATMAASWPRPPGPATRHLQQAF